MVNMNKQNIEELKINEFISYKNSLEHLKNTISQLLDRCKQDGINQNFSCNSEIVEMADRIKFISYKLYVLQNYLKEEK